MLILIGLWFARRHMALLLRLADLALRGLTLLRTAGPDGRHGGSSAGSVGLSKHRHEVPVHSIFKLWYMAPRLSLVAWLARWIFRGGIEDVLILAGPSPAVRKDRSTVAGVEHAVR